MWCWPWTLYIQSYIDPRNARNAREEAHNLLSTGDENEDDRLSLEEVLHNIHVFFGSKFVNTALNFHDEFWSARVDVALTDIVLGSIEIWKESVLQVI